MESFDRQKLTDLRAFLAVARKEKSDLMIEIASSSTSSERKVRAIRRRSSLAKEMRMTMNELETFLNAAKHAASPHQYR